MDDRATILIVDDVPMFRELESVFLARCGRVLTASSGNEGLALVESELPDVVLLDWKLQDMDASSFCRQVLSDPESAHVVIVAITSSGDPKDHEEAIRAGAADVLAKPLSRSQVVAAVGRFTRDGPARGLPRVVLNSPVQIRTAGSRVEGKLLNLSRGGAFVAASCILPLDSEVELAFRLPETDSEVVSRVTVVWRFEGEDGPGFGARFLDLDRDLASRLDDYVHERGGVPDKPPAAQTPRVIEATG